MWLVGRLSLSCIQPVWELFFALYAILVCYRIDSWKKSQFFSRFAACYSFLFCYFNWRNIHCFSLLITTKLTSVLCSEFRIIFLEIFGNSCKSSSQRRGAGHREPVLELMCVCKEFSVFTSEYLSRIFWIWFTEKYVLNKTLSTIFVPFSSNHEHSKHTSKFE